MRAGECSLWVAPVKRSAMACGGCVAAQLVSLGVSLVAAGVVTAWLVGTLSWGAMGFVFIPIFLLGLGLSGCAMSARPRDIAHRPGARRP